MDPSPFLRVGLPAITPRDTEEFLDRLCLGFLGLEKIPAAGGSPTWQGRGVAIELLPTPVTGSGAGWRLAFAARSRGEVEAFPAWAVRSGIEVTRSPRPCPDRGPLFFGCRFRGPEGMEWELVFEEPRCLPGKAEDGRGENRVSTS